MPFFGGTQSSWIFWLRIFCGYVVPVAPPWSQIEGLNHVLADPTLIRWAVPSAEEEENEGE